MTLDEQLATLATLGLTLEPGITTDDLRHSFDAASYEERPFDLILFMFGVEVEREPWGRPFCSRVWNFDTECVEGDGAYVEIAKRLCVVAGRPDAFTELRDHVDIEAGEAWIEYAVDGKTRRWDIEVNDDWADGVVVAYMMGDLERDGRMFRSKDNGQAMILFYLDDAQAARLSELAKEPLTKVTNPE